MAKLTLTQTNPIDFFFDLCKFLEDNKEYNYFLFDLRTTPRFEALWIESLIYRTFDIVPKINTVITLPSGWEITSRSLIHRTALFTEVGHIELGFFSVYFYDLPRSLGLFERYLTHMYTLSELIKGFGKEASYALISSLNDSNSTIPIQEKLLTLFPMIMRYPPTPELESYQTDLNSLWSLLSGNVNYLKLRRGIWGRVEREGRITFMTIVRKRHFLNYLQSEAKPYYPSELRCEFSLDIELHTDSISQILGELNAVQKLVVKQKIGG